MGEDANSARDANSLAPAEPYEARLNRNLQWALLEGSKHFEENNYVFGTLNKLVARLNATTVPFAVLGDLAMFRHGYRRYTEVVELLLTRDGLKAVHEQLVGDGYVLDRPRARSLRDCDFGVTILISVSGAFPGDGKPKPVAFPDPAEVAIEIKNTPCVRLETLFELKLASGISNSARQKDLGDAQELMRVLKLPREFADRLNPYVRDEYLRLWDGLQAGALPDDWDTG